MMNNDVVTVNENVEYEKLYSIIESKRKNNEDVNINIGCGYTKLNGYINIDYYEEAADVRIDIMSLSSKYLRVNNIVCNQVIEHFDIKQATLLLKNLYDMLEIGGTLRIETPDLIEISKRVINSTTADESKLLSILYGFPWVGGFAHKMIFSKRTLIRVLKEAGFTKFEDVESLKEDFNEDNIEKFDLFYDETVDPYEWFNDEDIEGMYLAIVATKQIQQKGDKMETSHRTMRENLSKMLVNKADKELLDLGVPEKHIPSWYTSKLEMISTIKSNRG